MSDQTSSPEVPSSPEVTPPPAAVTQETVHAIAATVPADAVAESHASPAPTDPLEQKFAAFDARLAAIETVLHGADAIANTMAPVVAAEVPAAAPVVSRLGAIESLLDTVLGGIRSAFGEKSPV